MDTDGDCKASKNPYEYPSTFTVVDGVLTTFGITKDFLKNVKNLLVRGDEIFVATYPKSGTTWVSEMLWQIYFDGKVDVRPIQDRIPFIDGLRLFDYIKTKEQLQEFFINHPYPRIFKTHFPRDYLPIGDSVTTKPKYINVIRNPKDCAVSFYHHMKGLEFFEFDGSWESFFEMFIEGNVIRGSWFDHVLGWWDHRDDPNILILKYEDMKKDLPSAVKQIAKFVGKDLSQETIQLIAKQTTFSAMSKNKGSFFNEDDKIFPRVQGAPHFLRRGEVGDWRNYFTEEQNRRFDELYDKKMAGSELELEF